MCAVFPGWLLPAPQEWWCVLFLQTATTVGGGYINGTAESIATAGLAWTLAPFGICAGLTIGNHQLMIMIVMYI